MNTTVLSLIITSFSLAPFACADTLTLRNNAEINGQVRYADGAFSITARYSAGSPLTRTFDRKEVLTLEFNQRDFNSGPPPKDISVFIGRESATNNAAYEVSDKPETAAHPTAQGQPSGQSPLASVHSPSDDVIRLRNKKELSGRLVKIENGKLTLQSGKKSNSLDSGRVAAVVVAPY
jgi:hypothetical protein